jgi:hypothetical protein
MKSRRILISWSVMALGMLMMLACDLSQGLFPPPTPTPTPTLTPTATNTPLPTPTATQPGPDFEDLVVRLSDLPPGFQAVSLEEFGLTREALSGDDLTVESVFAFMEYTQFEFVMGFTTLLPTRLDQASFDAELSDPEYLIEAFVLGLGASEILEQGEIPGLDVGDTSAGLTVVAGLEGIPMRMDMVVFRRDVIGAFVLIMYLDGEVPLISIEEVAGKLDDRVMDMLPLIN